MNELDIRNIRLADFNNNFNKTRQTASDYLSKLRRNSISADFQLVRRLTNYVYIKPLELRLSAFCKVS